MNVFDYINSDYLVVKIRNHVNQLALSEVEKHAHLVVEQWIICIQKLELLR